MLINTLDLAGVIKAAFMELLEWIRYFPKRCERCWYRFFECFSLYLMQITDWLEVENVILSKSELA